MAKLLDLCLALPSFQLPQFQTYRWVFIGEVVATAHAKEEGNFQTLATKISMAMDRKFPEASSVPLPFQVGRLLIEKSSVTSLAELKPFFVTLARGRRFQRAQEMSDEEMRCEFDRILQGDFLEEFTS